MTIEKRLSKAIEQIQKVLDFASALSPAEREALLIAKRKIESVHLAFLVQRMKFKD